MFKVVPGWDVTGLLSWLWVIEVILIVSNTVLDSKNHADVLQCHSKPGCN